MSTTKITVIKRDGVKVEFNKEKIANAIFKAAQSVGGVNKEIADNLADKIEEDIKKNIVNTTEIEKTVEEIQDLVEQTLIENNYDKTAKSYILYRNQRTRTREVGSYIAKTIRNIVAIDSNDSDSKRENGNINTDSTMGSMLKIGSETAKWFALNEILKPEHAQHHIDGTYHIHDLDFYLLTQNCIQIPLDKLLAKGFTTGHGFIRSPSNIRSAASLTCIVIQSSQNDFFGGQSIPLFDFYLAPYVKKSYIKQLISVFEVGCPASIMDILRKEFNSIGTTNVSLLNNNDLIFNTIMDVIQKENVKITYTEDEYKQRIYEMIDLAKQRTDKETYQAMEALIHNLNTMQSRAGSQTPFSSINFGMDTSEEGRMVSKNLLLAQEAGMGDGETSIFPITIFTVKGGYNYYPEDPNYDLFKLSCKVSAKRLFPNFNSIHNNFNTPYYKEGHPETQVAVMGNLYTEDKYITVRFNNSNDEIYKFNFNWFIENIEKEFNKYICEQDWIPAVNLKNSYYHNLQNVEVFDGSNDKFTKLKKVMYWDHEQFDTQWFVVYYAHPDKPREVQKLIATFDHPFPVQINNEIKRTRLIDIYKLIKENHEQLFLVGEANERINIVDIVNLDTTTMYRFTTTNIVFSDTEGTLSEETGDIKTYVRESSQEVKVYDLDNVLDYHESSKTKWNNVIRLTAKDLFMKLSDSVFDFTETNGGHIASYELLSKIEAGGTEFLTRSYDIETGSDIFALFDNLDSNQYIISHNCRTRVIGNVWNPDNEVTPGRGNLSFTTINLPRLGILANKDINKFFKDLDILMEEVCDQLFDRYRIQSKRKAKNFPFAVQEGVITGGENLEPDDELGDLLRDGTLTIGFIGLTEALVALTGKHHGESDESQELGLRIIKFMRDKMDTMAQKTKYNFSLIASPSEGTCGRLLRLDKKKFGIIAGITDKDYYTNSFHVTPGYTCTASHKIDIEAPYHKYCNAGGSSYCAC